MSSKFFITTVLILFILQVKGQNKNRIFVNTGFSVVSFNGNLRDVFKPTIGFSSAIELVTTGGWFAQGTLDMSSLKYHQQLNDEEFSHLLQNADADLLTVGLNLGRQFELSKRIAVSSYFGGGFFSISEPRIKLANNVATQEDIRKNSAFGRLGATASIQTGFKFLETVYVDGNWWTTPLSVQRQPLRGLAIVVGAKMRM